LLPLFAFKKAHGSIPGDFSGISETILGRKLLKSFKVCNVIALFLDEQACGSQKVLGSLGAESYSTLLGKPKVSKFYSKFKTRSLDVPNHTRK